MKLYICRHCEAEEGPQLDPTRPLTDTGKAQIPVMADFLQTQTDKIAAVLCSSDLKRGTDTGEGIAKRLDVPVIYTPWVDPEVDVKKCWSVIKKTAAGLEDGEELLVVSHGPTVNALAAYLLDSGDGDKFHFSHGSIAHFDTDDPAVATGYPDQGRGENVLAYMHWLVTAKLMNRAMTGDETAVIEEALRIANAVLGDMRVDEKGKAFYYDTVNEKRFVPDATACETCEEAGDLGWVEDEYVYDGAMGDEDGPPLHPHCGCDMEYRERRYRVYESGVRVLESEHPLAKQRSAVAD